MRKLIITIVVIALVVFVAYVIKESIETKSLDGYYAEAFDSPLRVRDPKLVRVSGLEEYKVSYLPCFIKKAHIICITSWHTQMVRGLLQDDGYKKPRGL